jgi:hypothetical protein
MIRHFPTRTRKPGRPPQRFRARGPGVLSEEGDGALNAAGVLGLDFPERFDRARSQLNTVAIHSQPRSALT